MSPEQYDPIPEPLTLREAQFHATGPGRRTETLAVVTTLTDPPAAAVCPSRPPNSRLPGN